MIYTHSTDSTVLVLQDAVLLCYTIEAISMESVVV